MSDNKPRRGQVFIVKDLWSSAYDSIPEAVKVAGRDLDTFDEEVFFVVEIKAVVRRKEGFDVE